MLTELKEEQIIALGARYKADLLLLQYRRTFTLAESEQEALLDLLPEGYMKDLYRAAEKVRRAVSEEFRAQEQGETTVQARREILKRASVWNMTARPPSDDTGLTRPECPVKTDEYGQKTDLSEITARVERNLRSLEAESLRPGKKTTELIHEGRAVLQCLKALDPAREMKRLRQLPESVRRFYYEKGLLYAGLWVVTDACRALCAGNADRMAEFNLAILEG